MLEALSSLANTQLPTILVVGGILFVFIALGGQLGAQVVTDRIKPGSALIAGVFFMILGVGLYASGGVKLDDGKGESRGSHSATPAKTQPDVPTLSMEAPNPPRVIFTRTLSEANQPTEDIKQITLNTETIYVFCSWFGITSGKEYRYHISILDGNDTLVSGDDQKFTSVTTSHDTWTWYKINKNVDHAGIWVFRISFGDQKTEARLVVLDK